MTRPLTLFTGQWTDLPLAELAPLARQIGYAGPLSVEWEDSRMDRLHGAAEGAAFARRLDFPASNVAFDAAFRRKA